MPPQNPEDEARNVAIPESADMPAPVKNTLSRQAVMDCQWHEFDN
jgi:hypothetical protein